MTRTTEWGDPSAIGFAALAGINLAFAGSFLGWWGPGHDALVFTIGIVGGIAQVATGLVQLQRGESSGGTLMTTFGLLFMWGPGTMLLLDSMGMVGALNPFFGAWSLFLGALLWTWSVTLVYEPAFEFLIGPVGGTTLVTAGLHDVVGLPAVVPGLLFVGLTLWGMVMLVHSLGALRGLTIPLGPPAIEALTSTKRQESPSATVSHGD
ncbi:MAG: hypothetical protein ACQEQY_06650 [Halobacteriota archaeon]